MKNVVFTAAAAKRENVRLLTASLMNICVMKLVVLKKHFLELRYLTFEYAQHGSHLFSCVAFGILLGRFLFYNSSVCTHTTHRPCILCVIQVCPTLRDTTYIKDVK